MSSAKQWKDCTLATFVLVRLWTMEDFFMTLEWQTSMLFNFVGMQLITLQGGVSRRLRHYQSGCAKDYC
jgi:hypothetical protein